MHPSLGCGTLSAKCTAGPNILGVLFVSFGVTLDTAETPLAETPFSRFLNQTKLLQNYRRTSTQSPQSTVSPAPSRKKLLRAKQVVTVPLQPYSGVPLTQNRGALAVESSVTVEDAVENRSL